jgi:hypothetical protein
MATPQVKIELKLKAKKSDSSAAPIEQSAKVEAQVKDEPNSIQEEITQMTPSEASILMMLKPLWKLCDDRPQDQQVKIGEDAAEQARKYFQRVEKVLNEHSSKVSSCETRLKEIGTSFSR